MQTRFLLRLVVQHDAAVDPMRLDQIVENAIEHSTANESLETAIIEALDAVRDVHLRVVRSGLELAKD